VRKVLTYGTFDLLHIGHLNLLERLRALGDHLTVAVSTDEFNAGKGKKCVIPYADRARLIGALSCVDVVIPECSWEQKTGDIVAHEIAIFGMGHDWTDKFNELKPLCEVVYLPRTEGVSTTMLRQAMMEARQK
jgi:glycerol-3-phosphate cytidylyltransferase